jgi:hypothetical protein
MGDNVSDVNVKTTVAARIPQELARSVAELAQRGNRTLSREIWAAVEEHVAKAPGASRPESDERGGPGSPGLSPPPLADGENQ